MKAFGFLSFGHYNLNGHPNGKETLKQAIELSQAADEIGVNGAYFRVHHFAPQNASPMPLLGAIAATTKHIEVGTGVIDMRYENPLYLAEEAAALDQIADGRVALGVSRGSPEPAERGWEAFGYTGSTDPRGADIAREHYEKFLKAVRGQAMAKAAGAGAQYPQLYRPGAELPVLPHSPGLDRRIWWGAATHASAEQAAREGVNLMSSTLVLEATGQSLSELQAEQIERYRAAWKEAGHDWTPRVSVSRSVFPVLNDRDRQLFGFGEHKDSIGMIDGTTGTFGRTYVDEPDKLIEQLLDDEAVQAADTLMLTIPNQAGVEINQSILANFAQHVAPALGWKPNQAGPVEGYSVQ